MHSRLLHASLALSLSTGMVPAQQPDPAALLRELVDQPDPALRSKRALELAKLPVTLDAWLGAARALAPREDAWHGEAVLKTPLWNGKALEETELYLFVPKDVDPQRTLGLMVQSHGTGADGEGQPGLWAAVAQELGMVVVAPSESGANEGYAYSERERQIALSAVRWARRSFRIDPDRVFLSGISRGGHLTWDVALRHPDLFAGIAPMIGAPRLNPGQAQNNMRYLDNLVAIPIRDLQGSLDDEHLVANLRASFIRLQELGAVDAKLVEFPTLGHAFDFSGVEWVKWMRGMRRDPCPTHVIRSAARSGEGRSFWCEITAFDGAKVHEEPALQFPAAVWEKLDEAGRRTKVQKLLDDNTARLDATLESAGRIRVKTSLVKQFRLLVTPSMCDDKGKLVVTWNGRPKPFTPRDDAAVLLTEFAERFDPGFLPTRSVTVQ
ncbi:MAG: PHB depolymerase family esterase [Planctomycetota bacterium]